jgi:hypothetical protein
MRSSLDIKTFSVQRKKPIDRIITDALYNEGYWVQAYYYHMLRELAREKMEAGEIEAHGAPEGWAEDFVKHKNHNFGLIFIQSSRPYHMQIKALSQFWDNSKEANIYWYTAQQRIDSLLTLHARCLERFGDKPWREPATPQRLDDLDLPQLIYS